MNAGDGGSAQILRMGKLNNQLNASGLGTKIQSAEFLGGFFGGLLQPYRSTKSMPSKNESTILMFGKTDWNHAIINQKSWNI